MTAERRVLVHTDKPSLAAAVAARFLTKLVDVLDDAEVAHICLTGGSVGGAVLESIRDSGARGSVDWSRVHFWFGDERYLPRGDAERNETQARAALLDHVSVDESQIHTMAAPGEHADIDAAAAAYAAELSEFAVDGDLAPRFEITFLGVGPDGHVASLFPGHDTLAVRDRAAVAEVDSPKPPSERISLTYAALDLSQRVWLVMAGPDKAAALGLALADASAEEVPATAVRGLKRTVFFVDQDAAAEVPEELIAKPMYWTAAHDVPEPIDV